MKRILCALALVVICGFSWYSVINSYKNGNVEFQELVLEAESQYEKKVFDKAEELYKKALDIRPNDEKALLGLANTYFSEEKYDNAVTVCENIIARNESNKDAKILEVESLMSGGKYQNTLNILNGMEQTDRIKALILEVKSKYSIKYFNIENPKNWLVNSPLDLYISTLYENDSPHSYNSKGERVAKGEISYLGPVSEDKELYPAIEDGTWCYVDSSGKRELVPDVEYDFLGPFSNGYAVAKKGEVFGYIDEAFNEYHFEYENAYNFYDGKAVVKDGENIKIIDTNFATVSTTNFDSVLADEYGYTNHFGKSVFISSGTHYLCNADGSKVSDFSAEYIGLPMEKDGMVEFQQNGKYGFLSSLTGKVVITATYDSAKAFSQGLAPVEVGEKWGFIDEDGQTIVEPIFEFASSISDCGTAWIENEAGFALLTFYHLSE